VALPSGSLILLLPSDPVPAGFTFVGSFRQNTDGAGSGITIRIYRKN
jgi:hypothetical protein